MKHYLESIDNVCADAQSSVDGFVVATSARAD